MFSKFSHILPCLLFALCLGQARAVVVDDTSMLYDTDPGTGVPWNNVVQVDGSSGVYLADGWIISAGHVTGTTAGNVTVAGVTYTIASNQFFDLTNPDSSASDVVLFNIGTNLSGMTDVAPITTAVSNNTALTMIGYGLQRSGGVIGVTYITGTVSGTAVTGTMNGYAVGSHSKGWGDNTYSTSNNPASDVFHNTTKKYQASGANPFYGYYTVFSVTGSSKTATDYTADSGGGVFVNVGGVWELAATMNAIGTLNGQQANTVANGDVSFLADMSVYSSQIISIMSVPEPSIGLLLGVGLLGLGGYRLHSRKKAKSA